MEARTGKIASSQPTARPAVPDRSYYRDREAASRYKRRAAVCLVALYAALALAVAGWLPPWMLLVVVPPLYCRAALNVHELMHICLAHQVSALHRLMMVLEAPVCLGYREHRDIHVRHHQRVATERDPEFFQIRGTPVRAFVHAMICPEWAFVSYVREKGMSRGLAVEGSIRLAVFIAMVAISPVVFAWYWVAVRLSVGVSSFLFHHVLHNRNGRYGTFDLAVSAPVECLMNAVLGRDGTSIVTEHSAHHAWQHVEPTRLRGLLDNYPKPVV